MAEGYTLIQDRAAFDEIVPIIENIDVAALDFEGWNIVRCIQIADYANWIVIDCGPKEDNWFRDIAHHFDKGQAWVAFNSSHEKRCFADHGGVYPTVWDSANLRKALEGGGHMSLKALVGWELGEEMSKEQQGSDWDNGELSQEQLDYAADDAVLTWEVWQTMSERADADHWGCFDLLDGMTDAAMAMQDNGILLDPVHHQSLIDEWIELRDEREEKIRELVTEDEVANLNSGKQVTDFMLPLLPDQILNAWPTTPKTGLLSMKNKDLITVAGMLGDNPLSKFLRLMSEKSTLDKYLSSFGETLLNHAKLGGGRVHARFNIAAAITCRFSCSGPNLQQIPRDRDFFGERLSIRKGFIAPEGRKLVSYDYSGIEMIMMALVSGDDDLLHDVIFGDPHAIMAEYVIGRPIDKTKTEDKELRQGMKGVNFGIIYGTTSLGLAGRNGWSMSYAEDLLNYWASRYPKAFGYRREVQEEAARNGGYIRMDDGGTIFMQPDKRGRVGITKCANYPVQRAALSVMARAIIRHYDSLEEAGRPVDMLATIHDALIDEADDAHAEWARETMKRDMLEGLFDCWPQLRDVPEDALVEGGTGPSWGELEEV